MQEENLQVLTEEEEEEDDGPPPGFQCIINPQPLQPDEDGVDEDDEEGPPPGFDSIVPKPPLPNHPDMASSIQDDDGDGEGESDEDDEEDGPPPGWEFHNLVNALPEKAPSDETADIKMETNEELDEGPPPGWETMLPNQIPPPRTPSLHPSPAVSPDKEIESKHIKIEDEVLPPVSQCMLIKERHSPTTPPKEKLPSPELPGDTRSMQEDKQIGDKNTTIVSQPASPLQQLPPTPRPVATATEKAQLVCSTCQKLCLYPRGAKLVRCPGCQEVNFVLEAHEVGQVVCGGCAVLLMYLHGCPAVHCSSCHFVTEIGAHNRKPPLSVQQAQRRNRSFKAR